MNDLNLEYMILNNTIYSYIIQITQDLMIYSLKNYWKKNKKILIKVKCFNL